MSAPAEFYDALSADYDVFVDWSARLAHELPLLEGLLRGHDARSVLDVACGTGQHAIALARLGYEVLGVDVSAEMVSRARANAQEAGVSARFERLGFGELADHLDGRHDALLCLGNSLPHLTDEAALQGALVDFSRVLRPEGLVVLQSRNYDRVLAERDRFMAPQSARRGDEEWLFVRFYDMEGPNLQFHMMRLYRKGGGEWSWRVERTPLRAWREAELRAALCAAGFSVEGEHAGLDGSPYEPLSSGDLVIVATR